MLPGLVVDYARGVKDQLHPSPALDRPDFLPLWLPRMGPTTPNHAIPQLFLVLKMVSDLCMDVSVSILVVPKTHEGGMLYKPKHLYMLCNSLRGLPAWCKEVLGRCLNVAGLATSPVAVKMQLHRNFGKEKGHFFFCCCWSALWRGLTEEGMYYLIVPVIVPIMCRDGVCFTGSWWVASLS